MTRDLNAAFQTEQRADENEPIILLEIETKDVSEPWLYLANQPFDVVFPTSGGNTYTAWPFHIDAWPTAGEESDPPLIRVADVWDADAGSWVIDTWLKSTDFRWHTVIRRQVQQDELDSSAKALVDAAKIEQIRRDGRVAFVDLISFASLLASIRLPSGILARDEFPGLLQETPGGIG